MSTLTPFVFLAVLLVIVAADDDRDSCSPGRACQELERRVEKKRDAYETLCNSDNNLTKKCCRVIKKEVKKYEDAYDLFCATKPTPGPTTSQAKPTPGPTTAEANPTQGPTTAEAKPTPGPTTPEAISTPGPTTSEAKPTQALTTAELVAPPLPTTQAKGLYDGSPWIQIDLGKKSVITGVATQGSCNDVNRWVTSYAIRYSEDGVNWTYYNKGQPFPANKDASSVVKNEIETPFEARFVRIYPKTKHFVFYSMRIELYGCRK